jgi:hypothetical protein
LERSTSRQPSHFQRSTNRSSLSFGRKDVRAGLPQNGEINGPTDGFLNRLVKGLLGAFAPFKLPLQFLVEKDLATAGVRNAAHVGDLDTHPAVRKIEQHFP